MKWPLFFFKKKKGFQDITLIERNSDLLQSTSSMIAVSQIPKSIDSYIAPSHRILLINYYNLILLVMILFD